MEKEYILPVGSVVTLTDGDGQKILIIGRAQLYNHEGTLGYFDYSAVLYPHGVMNGNEFVFFNHEDIKEIIFVGYRDEMEIKFAEKYDEEATKSNYPKLSVE